MQYEGRQLKKFASTGRRETLERKTSLSEIFHENTKLTPLGARSYGLILAKMNKSPLVKHLTSAPYKVYSLRDQEALEPQESSNNELERTINARRSVRKYTGEPMTRAELSKLLHYSYGITDPKRGWRSVPSGGALFPLEFYPVVLNVEGMEPGIYHYNVEEHCLDAIQRGSCKERLEEVVSFQDVDIETASVVMIVTAVFLRSTIKYSDRGYRMTLMECGAAAQNLVLTATSLGLGACMLGGFLDNDLSKLLDVDGYQEAPLLPIVLGRSPLS